MIYCNAFGFMPALAKLVQNVCPYGIIRTNRKTPYYQGCSSVEKRAQDTKYRMKQRVYHYILLFSENREIHEQSILKRNFGFATILFPLKYALWWGQAGR